MESDSQSLQLALSPEGERAKARALLLGLGMRSTSETAAKPGCCRVGRRGHSALCTDPCCSCDWCLLFIFSASCWRLRKFFDFCVFTGYLTTILKSC